MSLVSVRLKPAAVKGLVEIGSKDAVLDQAAKIAAAEYKLDKNLVRERLAERETLGSTGFGGAIAIPHAKIANLDNCVGIFLRLGHAIEFAAYDAKPVDLIFVLLSPENAGVAHLKALAEISRSFRDQHLVSKLRDADGGDTLFALLTGQPGQQAA